MSLLLRRDLKPLSRRPACDRSELRSRKNHHFRLGPHVKLEMAPPSRRQGRDGTGWHHLRLRCRQHLRLCPQFQMSPRPMQRGRNNHLRLSPQFLLSYRPLQKGGSSWNDISDEARYNAAFHQFKQNKGYKSLKAKRTKRLTLPSRCRFGWRRKGVVTEPTSMHV